MAILMFGLSMRVMAVEHTNNMVLTVRMQWSTNGTDWNEDQANFVDWDEFSVKGLSTNCFFYSQVTNWWGSYDIYEPVSLQHYWGSTLDAITNELTYSTFYVVPNRNTYPDIVYRPFLSITNYP